MMPFREVALLGYGRFGRALAQLLRERQPQVRLRALDAQPELVPEEERAPSLEALCQGAELLILAVPVPALRESLLRLRPRLDPGQVVMDVGSVKVRPEEDFSAVLGAEIPWVGTHPLFGPMSLLLAERPLRVVLCGSALHPRAAAQGRDFYEALGCEVIAESAAQHDWVMASTHAMAFFLAKGMIDAGFGEGVPFSPPSFQAMARTIEAVRGDAGHLFLAIQHDNPYSAAARARLLGALQEADRSLQALPEAPAAAAAAAGPEVGLSIPDLGGRSPELREVRELIDGLDRELVGLLGRRAELARRAARAKASMGHGVRDAAREASLFEARRAWARDEGLDPAQVEAIFNRIVGYSRKVQEEG